jgi:hypothetical protein
MNANKSEKISYSLFLWVGLQADACDQSLKKIVSLKADPQQQ